MAALWPVNLLPADKDLVTKLAQRRKELGLTSSYADTIRGAVRAMLELPDEDIAILLERADRAKEQTP